MYNLSQKLGNVITIRAVGGQEYVGALMAVDEENELITVYRPRMVMINDNQVYMVPFALTANAPEAVLRMDQIFTILDTLPETAAEYQNMIEAEDAVEEKLAQTSADSSNEE